MSSVPFYRALLLFVALVLACAPRPEAPPSIPAPQHDYAELEATYRARADSARMRFTAADARFMQDMIAHHAQAIVMSRLAPERAGQHAVRVLAARIINAQQGDIQLMQQWLRERGQPVPDVHIEGIRLHVHGVAHTHMPGMLTEAALEALEQARGAIFDERFLRAMIEHHRGAVTMVNQLFTTDGAAQDATVFKFASDVHVDQVTEIARMEQMLDALSRSGGAR